MTSEESTAQRMEPGEIVEGKVIELDRMWTDQGHRWVPVVKLRLSDTTLRTIIGFHEQLARKLADRRPRIGDKLKITCHGERQTKDGRRTVVLYSVEGGQEPDSNVFWQGIGAQHPARDAGPRSTHSDRPPQTLEGDDPPPDW